MNKRKFFGTIIGIIFWSICVVFFTYAYYEWKSESTNVVLGIQDLATECVKGANVNATKIGPVLNYQDGVTAEFSINNGLSTSKLIPLVLNITSISDNLLVDYFKYVLVVDIEGGTNYNYNTPVATGNFANFAKGSNNIASIVVDGNSIYSYQFIVYIDGNVKNDPNIQNNSLKSNLVLGDCGAVSSVPLTIKNNARLLSLKSTTEEASSSVIPQTITVTNTSEEDYSFDVVLRDIASEDSIDSQYIMTRVGNLESKSLADCTNNIIKEDVIVPAGESVDIDVRVWLDSSAPTSELDKGSYPKLSIDGLIPYNGEEEIDNSDLKLIYMNTSSTSNFRNATYLTYIKNASFVDYIDTSNASINTETNEKIMWDMSTKQDNSVIAWLEDNGTTDDSGNKYYNLYIGCNYKIYAKNLEKFFYNMTSIENITVSNLDTGLTTNMKTMFSNCSNLVSLDVSDWDTSNIVNMYYLFNGCSNLTFLDVSNWDTSMVTNMQQTFFDCRNLVSLDVSDWDTSNVTSMTQMFYSCNKLTTLDVSNWNTSNVTSMSGMFCGCSNLTSLIVSSFDTSTVTTMSTMFYGCSSLTSLDVSNFDTSKVTNMGSMFYVCSSLTSLDVSNFDTSKVTDMSHMFRGCSSLTSLDVSGFDTSKVTNMYSMFYGVYFLNTAFTIMNSAVNYSLTFYIDSSYSHDRSITLYFVGDNPATTDINESTESIVNELANKSLSDGTSEIFNGGCVGNYCSS